MSNLISVRNLVILAVALGLVSTGLYFYQEGEAKKLAMTRDAIFEAQKSFEEEVKALPETSKVPGVKLDIDAVFAKSTAALKDVAQKGSAKQGRFEAAIRLAGMYAEHDKGGQALEWAKVAESNASTDFQKSSANIIIANALESANDFDKAKESLDKIISSKADPLKGEAYVSMIRLLVKNNKAAEAKTYLEKLKKLTFASGAVSRAEKLVEAN